MDELARSIPYRDKLDPAKLELIDRAFTRCRPRPRVFADLGCLWRVHGGYSLYAVDRHGFEHGYLVDTHVPERAEAWCEATDRLTIVQGNFGDPAVADRLPRLDCVFMFSVLLHQVRPHWHEVLALYAGRGVRHVLIHNQQYTAGPLSVRLLDLGPEEYFRQTPHGPDHPVYRDLFDHLDEKHPDHDRTWRDVHHIWQWGITDRDLLAVMEDLGYGLQYYANCGRFGKLPTFENHAFIFTSRR